MQDSSLLFELGSISLLLVLGSILIMSGLPGWGLIYSAALLTALSLGLRKVLTPVESTQSANSNPAKAV